MIKAALSRAAFFWLHYKGSNSWQVCSNGAHGVYDGVKTRFGSRLYHQLDSSFDFILNVDICKFRDTGHKNTVILQISGRQNEGFHCLVHRASTDRLHFGPMMLTDNPGNSTRYRGRTRIGRNLDHIHRILLLSYVENLIWSLRLRSGACKVDNLFKGIVGQNLLDFHRRRLGWPRYLY